MKPIYKIMFFVSLVVLVLSFGALLVYGLNFGVDFTGGSAMELEFLELRPSVSETEAVLDSTLPDLEFLANPAGENRVIIKTSELSEADHQKIIDALGLKFGKVDEKSFDSIGPTVGQELRNKSIIAIFIVLIAIACYIAFVFRKLSRTLSLWAMNLSALVGLLHDIIIPMGIFAILGHYYNVEISAIFVAAVLTILGYTVSDKVVIFDRVRENILKGDKSDLGIIVHKSVMQTLVRSINNTLTVILSSAAIYFFGGESIRYFALALMIGIFLGAYSSIFVASPLLVYLQKRKK
ncbi:MAG: protein-export membrane protein SecF [Candidatus Yanofskybacteria bacterium RIFCSPHIGHO2_02_FULL_41_11]|uniref:Protein-export membrane protein SecF n=1 Tax=Candidatus Yanofskybacteria bacterium RIFCSPHIGHO2_02_FULL_41_11 TaxID=1802675 RepID=A0A1F8F7Z0_9BACT|nr:MAG: protein-export membrane protein SecF [Candidatus Yanofskybacteria bacterium RIFCSPHIGHO2_02_FULL_41_11]